MSEIKCETCTMTDIINRIQTDLKDSIQERKANEKESRIDISLIKAGQEKATYITEQVQKTQDAMALVIEKNQATSLAANAAGFKEIKDQREKDDSLREVKEEKFRVETLRLKEISDIKEEKSILEKKRNTRALWMVFYVIAANTIFGLFVKYAPALIKLPIGK